MNAAAWAEFNWQRPRWEALEAFAKSNERAARVLGPFLEHWDDEVTTELAYLGWDPVDESLLPGFRLELGSAMTNAWELGWTEYVGDKPPPPVAVEDVILGGREAEAVVEAVKEVEQAAQAAVDATGEGLRIALLGAGGLLAAYFGARWALQRRSAARQQQGFVVEFRQR